MFEIIEKGQGQKPFPLERAVLISIAAHVAFLVLFLITPSSTNRADPAKGLLAGLLGQQSKEPPVPVVFRSAPGPARENRARSAPSDADRRAGGGDRSRPRAASPYVPSVAGIAEVEAGRRGASSGSSAAQAVKPAQAARGEPDASGEERPSVFGPPGTSSPGSPVVAGGSRSREGDRLASLDQAIRQAARDTAGGGGQGGAGFPNADGGFVDSGPLSFDTTWYDWGAYAEEMVRRIKLHWDIPELARLGWKGKLTIRFFILADGRVADATIIRQSGIPPFDFAALQAILKSSPFRPLPSDLGSSREGVTVTFFYNLRPEKEGPSQGTR